MVATLSATFVSLRSSSSCLRCLFSKKSDDSIFFALRLSVMANLLPTPAPQSVIMANRTGNLVVVPGRIQQGARQATDAIPNVSLNGIPLDVFEDHMVPDMIGLAGAQRPEAIAILSSILIARYPFLFTGGLTTLGCEFAPASQIEPATHAVLMGGPRAESAQFIALLAPIQAANPPADANNITRAERAAWRAAQIQAANQAGIDQFIEYSIAVLGLADIPLNPASVGTRREKDAFYGLWCWASHHDWHQATQNMFATNRPNAARRVSGADAGGPGVLGLLYPAQADFNGWKSYMDLNNARRAQLLANVLGAARLETTDDIRPFWATLSMLSTQGVNGIYHAMRLCVTHQNLLRSIPALEAEAAILNQDLMYYFGWSAFDKAFKKAIYGSAITMVTPRAVKNITAAGQVYAASLRPVVGQVANDFGGSPDLMARFRAAMARMDAAAAL